MEPVLKSRRLYWFLRVAFTVFVTAIIALGVFLDRSSIDWLYGLILLVVVPLGAQVLWTRFERLGKTIETTLDDDRTDDDRGSG